MNSIVELSCEFRFHIVLRSTTMAMGIKAPGFEDSRKVCSQRRLDVMV